MKHGLSGPDGQRIDELCEQFRKETIAQLAKKVGRFIEEELKKKALTGGEVLEVTVQAVKKKAA